MKYFLSVSFAIWSLFLLLIFLAWHPTYLHGIEKFHSFFLRFVDIQNFFSWFFPEDVKSMRSYRDFLINAKTVLPLFLFLFVFIFSCLFKTKDKITIPPILVLFWFSLIFGSFFCIFLNFFYSESSFDIITFFKTQGSNMLKSLGFWSLFFFAAIILTLFILFLGKIFLDIFYRKEEEFSLLEIGGIGFIILAFLGFLAAKIKLFHPLLFSGIFGICLVIFWEKFLSLTKKIGSENIKIFWWEVFLGSILGTIFIMTLLQVVMPFPLGWDTMNQYWLTVKILMVDGTLRPGILPPFTEIVLGVGAKFLGLSFVAFLQNFWGVFLIIFLVYLGQKLQVSRKINFLLALTFFTLPALQFELLKDLKIDVIFLEIILLGFIFWTKKFYRLAALAFGFAVLQKISAIIFFPVFVFLLFFKKISWPKKLIYPLFLFIPITIWLSGNILKIKNLFPINASKVIHFFRGEIPGPKIFISKYDKKISSKKEINTQNKKIEKNNPEVPSSTQKKVTKKIRATGYEEEVERYGGHSDNFLKKIWAIFTSPEIPNLNKQYVDINFLWLSFIPFLIFFALEKIYFLAKEKYQTLINKNENKKIEKKLDEPEDVIKMIDNYEDSVLNSISETKNENIKNIIDFFIFALFFFVLWIWKLEAVAWYGFPSLIIFFLLSGKIFDWHKSFKRVFLMFLVINFSLNIWSYLQHNSWHSVQATIIWSQNYNEKVQDALETKFLTEEKKAAKIINRDSESRIYRIGTLMKFWIKNPDNRIYDDAQLDMFTELFAEEDLNKTLERFRENKFKYVLLDLGTTSIERDKQGSLHQKFNNFKKFASQKLRKLYQGPKRLILFEVP